MAEIRDSMPVVDQQTEKRNLDWLLYSHWSDLLIGVIGLIAGLVTLKFWPADPIYGIVTGIGLPIFAYVAKHAYLTAGTKKSITDLSQRIDTLALYNCPDIVLSYFRKVWYHLKSDGFEMDVQGITYMASYFFGRETKSILATWKIQIEKDEGLEHYWKAQEKLDDIRSKTRVIVVSPTGQFGLKEQIANSRPAVEKFVTWHSKTGIDLYWLDPKILIEQVYKRLKPLTDAEKACEYQDFIYFGSGGGALVFDPSGTVKQGQKPEEGKLYKAKFIQFANTNGIETDPNLAMIADIIRQQCQRGGKARRIKRLDDLLKCAGLSANK